MDSKSWQQALHNNCTRHCWDIYETLLRYLQDIIKVQKKFWMLLLFCDDSQGVPNDSLWLPPTHSRTVHLHSPMFRWYFTPARYDHFDNRFILSDFCRSVYDSDITIWSPQGRIHQIEYAMEAVKQGSACVGLKSKNFAVIAALKRASSELGAHQKKIFKIDEHIGIAISGLTGWILRKVLCGNSFNFISALTNYYPLCQLTFFFFMQPMLVCFPSSWDPSVWITNSFTTFPSKLADSWPLLLIVSALSLRELMELFRVSNSHSEIWKETLWCRFACDWLRCSNGCSF